MNIGKLKRSTQIAIMSGAGSGTVEKTVSGTAPLTLSDSVVGNILSITINGRSEVSAGYIVSVGDNGLTVTTANSDSTVTTSAVVTTALPLRGVSDTVKDKLTCTADSKQVETMCGKVKLADLPWQMNVSGGFSANLQTAAIGIIPLMCSTYVYDNTLSFQWIDFNEYQDKTIYRNNGSSNIYLKNTDYSTLSDFVASLGDAELVYELATHVTTPLTTAEISALAALSTYDPTTIISVTDNPSITVKYMGKTITRTAPKKRSNRKKKA